MLKSPASPKPSASPKLGSDLNSSFMPRVARLRLYPIKSLDPVEVSQVTITAGGSLRQDRAYRLVDDQGRVINGKRTAQVHLIRAQFHADFSADYQRVTLSSDQDPTPTLFDLSQDRSALQDWFSAYFGIRVYCQENREIGFPDDLASPGPTVISVATLQTTAAWFSGLSVDQMRDRLRMNIELEQVPAFWEDTLFGAAGKGVRFQIGSVELHGINPCARCIVPTRDPRTGQGLKGFQPHFTRQRRQTLPPEVNSSRFDHFYRLGLNTRIPPSQAHKTIRVGDPVECTGA